MNKKHVVFITVGIWIIFAIIGFFSGWHLVSRQTIYRVDEEQLTKLYADVLRTYYNFTVNNEANYLATRFSIKNAVPIMSEENYEPLKIELNSKGGAFRIINLLLSTIDTLSKMENARFHLKSSLKEIKS